MNDNNTIGKRIKQKRLERDWEQQELARYAGLTKQTLCKIENGKTQASIPSITKIADALKCTIDELLGRKAG